MKSVAQILTIICLITSGLVTTDLYGQKRKDKEKQEKGISKYERANAEYLFIEAQKFFLLEDYERALAFLDQSLDIDPQNDAAHFKIAEINLVTNKYDRGISAIDRAIELKADNKYYYILAAQLYKAKEQPEKAVEQYEQMVANTSDYKEFLLDMTDLYVELNNYNKALSTLELTEKEFGTPDKFMLQKKELLVEAGRTDEAIDYMKRLLAKDQENQELLIEYNALLTLTGRTTEAIAYLEPLSHERPAVRPLLMTQYLRAGMFEKANPLLESVIEQNALDLKSLMSLADDLLNLENEQSLTSLKKLIDHIVNQAPEDPEALSLQVRLLNSLVETQATSASEDYETQAIEALMKSKESDPSNFQNWKRILDYQFQHENWQALLKESEASLDFFPNQGLFYFYFGSASLYTGATDEVADLMNQSLRLSASNDSLKSRIFGKQGELAFNLGQSEQAKSHFEQSFSLVRLPEVINNYSFQLALRKVDEGQALQLANELIETIPNELKYIRTKAFVLFQSASYAQARQVIEEGLQRLEAQVNGPARELYGDILIKLDLIDEAVDQWQKAKALGNTSEKLDQKIANKEYFE